MSTPRWIVKNVIPKENYTLLLTFADGSNRIYDASKLLNKPIYESLKSLPFFLLARAECGTVVWNDDIDIAPEHLYETSTIIKNNL